MCKQQKNDMKTIHTLINLAVLHVVRVVVVEPRGEGASCM